MHERLLGLIPSFIHDNKVGLIDCGINPRINEGRLLLECIEEGVDGGFLILPTAAAYRLEIEVSSKLSPPYFIRALFENPADPDKPFVEESVMSQPQKVLTLTHGPVKGLRVSSDYRITIKVFRNKEDAEPIDVLEQKVRSYVDSTGAAIKMKGGMKSQ